MQVQFPTSVSSSKGLLNMCEKSIKDVYAYMAISRLMSAGRCFHNLDWWSLDELWDVVHLQCHSHLKTGIDPSWHGHQLVPALKPGSPSLKKRLMEEMFQSISGIDAMLNQFFFAGAVCQSFAGRANSSFCVRSPSVLQLRQGITASSFFLLLVVLLRGVVKRHLPPCRHRPSRLNAQQRLPS